MPNTREKLIELLYKAEEQADKRCDFLEVSPTGCHFLSRRKENDYG